jgi:hypothetical protein
VVSSVQVVAQADDKTTDSATSMVRCRMLWLMALEISTVKCEVPRFVAALTRDSRAEGQ